jgi:hypothetical protein
VTATAEARRKSAELAQRFTGWTVWVTAQGSPVATRSGGQRPPSPWDGNWAQTIIADDWDELETELVAQAKYDTERLSNQTTYRLPYWVDDGCRPYLCPSVASELSTSWSLSTARGALTSRTW